MRTYSMTAVIWKEKDAYVSKCPETGVASCGDTPEEALNNLKEAVELYLDNAKRLGLLRELRPILTAPGKFTASFAASVR
ncbi:type II toxin-antitoxin system HicB family antitoxin [Candidatus Binatia bacterium]|nr:type II toxin-antitoxin system HicB family antitoxin [Candidatus Binatia bacterium]